MFKITFGKTRYNADKLMIDDSNNQLQLGNGFVMTNLCANVSLHDFLAYVNKHYHLGDNIINADIWYSRNGGSENSANYIVERLDINTAPSTEPSFERLLFIDERQVHNYGVKIMDVEGDLILLMTPRFVYTIRLSQGKLHNLAQFKEAIAHEKTLTMPILTKIVQKLTQQNTIALSSHAYNRNS